MKSALRGFLGTFTSRYSDYQGYWLLGQLPASMQQWTVDLLGSHSDRDSPTDSACRLAIRRFTEQLGKSGLSLDVVREATLQLVRNPNSVEGRQGDYMAEGQFVDFVVRVVMDNGCIQEETRAVFVAPHDPGKERRRNPESWGT